MRQASEELAEKTRPQAGDETEALIERQSAELARANQELQREISARQRAERALRESQERHRTLIESLPVGLFRKGSGPAGAFLLANQALVQTFGCESREELLRADMTDFCESPDDWAAVYDEVTARGRVIAREMRLKKKDGTPMWGAVTATAVHNALGEIQHVNGLIEDVTERKLLETQLAQAQKLEAMG